MLLRLQNMYLFYLSGIQDMHSKMPKGQQNKYGSYVFGIQNVL